MSLPSVSLHLLVTEVQTRFLGFCFLKKISISFLAFLEGLDETFSKSAGPLLQRGN